MTPDHFAACSGPRSAASRRRAFTVILCLLVSSSVSRSDDADLAQAMALERTMQKAIARAEPAIACILVSRSEEYRKLQPAASLDEGNGHLDAFDPKSVDNLPLTVEQKTSLRKKLDLADADVVPESFGSGIVLDTRGLILTNYHVVRDAVKIFVRL